MSINIKEKDGEFIFKEIQNYSQEGIVNRYGKDLMKRRIVKVQVDKLPNQIKEEKGYIDLTKLQIEQIKDRINQSEKIFKKRQINPSEELKKIREKYCKEYDELSKEEKENLKNLDEPIKDRDQYADRELTKKSQTILEKQTFQIKDNGQNIERITRNAISPEDEIIVYAGNQYYLLQAQEKLVKQNKGVEKSQIRLDATKEELEKVEKSLHSIKQYFKKKRKDIDKLLDEQAKNRKGKKEAEEIPYVN